MIKSALDSFILKCCNIFRPRLGRYVQHAPLPMNLPAPYIGASESAELPKISIVTPSYQQADFIEKTIESILHQSYPNLEYFVQDGNSDDGTKQILMRYSEQLTGWESCPDEGQAHAINLGFSKTGGEIMAWLNSDDLLLPGALYYVADYFNRHPEVDVVYGHRMLIDENDQQIGRWIMPSHENEILSWADYVPQETLFWRRSIWDKAGGCLDESFRFAMDWDLLVRFREAGAKFCRLDRLIGGFRIHATQKTSAQIDDVGVLEMDRIRERIHGRIPSYGEVRKRRWLYLIRHVFAELWWQARTKLE